MPDILQTTFSHSFSCIKWLYSIDNDLAPNMCQAIIWTSDGLIYWRIYTSLGVDELRNEKYVQCCGFIKRELTAV